MYGRDRLYIVRRTGLDKTGQDRGLALGWGRQTSTRGQDVTGLYLCQVC
jgi:hypothetical protein